MTISKDEKLFNSLQDVIVKGLKKLKYAVDYVEPYVQEDRVLYLVNFSVNDNNLYAYINHHDLIDDNEVTVNISSKNTNFAKSIKVYLDDLKNSQTELKNCLQVLDVKKPVIAKEKVVEKVKKVTKPKATAKAKKSK